MTEVIPYRNNVYQRRHFANVPLLSFRHTFLKSTFFLLASREWNKLDPSLPNSAVYNIFKINFFRLRPSPYKFLQSHIPKAIKLVISFRLGLSHFQGHRFQHSFQKTSNLFCNSNLNIETPSYYFLYCVLFHAE